jgi:hypothetical protein
MEELNRTTDKKAADPPKKEDKPKKKVQIDDVDKDDNKGPANDNEVLTGGKKKTITPKKIPDDLKKPDDSKNAALRKAYLSAKPVIIPELTVEEKKNLMKKAGSLTEYLTNYKCTFTKDIDKLWEGIDSSKNGYLDKLESEKFLEEIAGAIDSDRAYNYDKAQFK